MPDWQEVKAIEEAVNLSKALHQSNNYLSGIKQLPKPTSTVTTNPQFPVLTHRNRPFAGQLLINKNNFLYVDPKKAPPQTLIEFHRSNLTQYGQVIKPAESDQPTIFVNPISANKAARLIKEQPHLNRLTLTLDNARPNPKLAQSLPAYNTLPSVIIDPLDRFIFRLLLFFMDRYTNLTPQTLKLEFWLILLFALSVIIGVYLIAVL